MAIARIEVDFNPFPDDWRLGHRFLQGGFTFEHQGAITEELVVNETLNERGLVIPSDDGLLITLPVLTHAFGFRLGTFAGAVLFEYFNDSMEIIGSKTINWGNQFQDLGASVNKNMKYFRFSGGGGEGLLRSLNVLLNCKTALSE